ncbi:exonuclease RNase T and DNA polymerase III [Cerioporus squamosus]|nr:exonuclease RNase T and DNA polymerase III [Cerioporus squamosus]
MSVFRSIPRLRYLLILDFEATCGDEEPVVPRNEMEIIELPTLLYDIEQDKVKAIFHEYVRPVRHPVLTRFCTDLTGIEQSTVDAADPFPTVWERYQEFLREHGILQEPESVAYLTCGDWDLKTMLPMQLRLSGIQVGLDPSTGALAAPYNRWINVKKSFQRLYGLKNPRGMAGMLRNAHMQLEGRHHSGIDDCKNILRIVQRMRQDGWKPWNDLPR